MIKSLPPEPDRLATKDDLAVQGAALRTDMAQQHTDTRDLMNQQTRLLLLGLLVPVLLLAIAQVLA